MASSSAAVVANPPNAAARPVYRPMTEIQRLTLQVKAALVARMGDREGFDWLKLDLISEEYLLFFADNENCFKPFCMRLMRDQPFKDLCIEVRDLRRGRVLDDWQVVPHARMRLARVHDAGTLLDNEIANEHHTTHVVLLPNKTKLPRNQNSQPDEPLLEAVLDLSHSSYPTFRLLQQLARDKEWSAYTCLTANASGDARSLADLIASRVLWSGDLEVLRARLIADWRVRADDAGHLAPLVYLEDVVGAQTLMSMFETCNGCTRTTLCLMHKNPDQVELAVAMRRRPRLMVKMCLVCPRLQRHHLTFMLPLPVIVAWQRGERGIARNVERAFRKFEMTLEQDEDNLYDAYAACVNEFGKTAEGIVYPLLLLRRNGAWHKATNDLESDEPYVLDLQQRLGLNVIFVVYLRRRRR